MAATANEIRTQAEALLAELDAERETLEKVVEVLGGNGATPEPSPKPNPYQEGARKAWETRRRNAKAKKK